MPNTYNILKKLEIVCGELHEGEKAASQYCGSEESYQLEFAISCCASALATMYQIHNKKHPVADKSIAKVIAEPLDAEDVVRLYNLLGALDKPSMHMYKWPLVGIIGRLETQLEREEDE